MPIAPYISGLGAAADFPWPRLQLFEQSLGPSVVLDLDQAVDQEVARVASRLPTVGEIAVAVGSRGLANLPQLVRALVRALRRRGLQPFVVPAMGSHGGATAQGQRALLAHLGVDENSVEAPVRCTMEVTEVARLADGTALYCDALAAAAAGVVVLNRVKPHTAFHGRIESGISKMLVIGLGKEQGARTLHHYGFSAFAELIPQAAQCLLDALQVPFGLAVVENGLEQTAMVRAVVKDNWFSEEEQLLAKARALMARLPFDRLDVLLVGEMGKNISGDGMDPNVTGRHPHPAARGTMEVGRLGVLDLTAASEGNANGMGMADFVSRRVWEKIEPQATYRNALASSVTLPVKLPMVLESDRAVLAAALMLSERTTPRQAAVVIIRNTLALRVLALSEALWPTAARQGLKALASPFTPQFGPDGQLPTVGGLHLYVETEGR